MFAVLASLIRDIICFVPFVCVLPIFYGVNGILASAPIADAVAIVVTVVMTVAFFAGINKKAKEQQAGEDLPTEAEPETIEARPTETEQSAEIDINIGESVYGK